MDLENMFVVCVMLTAEWPAQVWGLLVHQSKGRGNFSPYPGVSHCGHNGATQI